MRLEFRSPRMSGSVQRCEFCGLLIHSTSISIVIISQDPQCVKLLETAVSICDFLTEILHSANIEYIKWLVFLGQNGCKKCASFRRVRKTCSPRWDMNRALTDAFSAALPSATLDFGRKTCSKGCRVCISVEVRASFWN